jgi:hypothetical protein
MTRRGLSERLVDAAIMNQQRKSAEQFSDPDRSFVEKDQPFEEDPQRYHAAEQDDPHERTAFLQEFKHAKILVGA